jgi:hypothetical protein
MSRIQKSDVEGNHADGRCSPVHSTGSTTSCSAAPGEAWNTSHKQHKVQHYT